ncbi:MAG TPA: phage Gp37/Gp68 family protein [Candidatus Moranbacteria bacterium]|nr:phage Gp37/Gp68 family protein [Candidatus Moranbacteria bacterium]
MTNSKIEWTEVTWNPTTGCSKISDGCKHCYAEIMSYRLKAMGLKKYEHGFSVRVHNKTLTIPFEWKKPRLIFVNSMSDLFHQEIPISFIKEVFKVMNSCPQHTFQVLTKRGDILEKYSKELSWSPNIWMGVSVENMLTIDRIDCLRNTQAAVKFISFEPLLEHIEDINLNLIDWVIVGGESGSKSRPIKKGWVEAIHRQCISEGVKFFFKQWGGKNKKKAGRLLNKKTYSEMPQIEIVRGEKEPNKSLNADPKQRGFSNDLGRLSEFTA